MFVLFNICVILNLTLSNRCIFPLRCCLFLLTSDSLYQIDVSFRMFCCLFWILPEFGIHGFLQIHIYRYMHICLHILFCYLICEVFNLPWRFILCGYSCIRSLGTVVFPKVSCSVSFYYQSISMVGPCGGEGSSGSLVLRFQRLLLLFISSITRYCRLPQSVL